MNSHRLSFDASTPPDHHTWDQWLAQPPVEVYKTGPRSRVWRVHLNDDKPDVVIKQYTYKPVRQHLAYYFYTHIGQHERHKTNQMIQDGLPVIPILGIHKRYCLGGLGMYYYLATQYVGLSFAFTFRQKKLTPDSPSAPALLKAVGHLPVQLLQKGWVFRDLKASNIVIDDQLKPWLIDVGGARRIRSYKTGYGHKRAWRMLQLLDATMKIDGWPPEYRRQCLSEALALLSPDPVEQAYDKLCQIVLK